MTRLSSSTTAPLLRALSVLAIGTALALGHTAFARAAGDTMQAGGAIPANALRLASADPVEGADAAASVSGGRILSENCYLETRIVKGLRGKAARLHILECD